MREGGIVRRIVLLFLASTWAQNTCAGDYKDWSGWSVTASGGFIWQKISARGYGNPFWNSIIVPGTTSVVSIRAPQTWHKFETKMSAVSFVAGISYVWQFERMTAGVDTRFGSPVLRQQGKSPPFTQNTYLYRLTDLGDASTRLRVGYAYGSAHFYGFAGVGARAVLKGYGFFRSHGLTRNLDYIAFDKSLVVRPSLSLGFGLDWALTDRIFMSLEAHQSFLKAAAISKNYPVGGDPYGHVFKGHIIPSPTENFKTFFRQRTSSLRLGVGYRL